jgi:predicted DNA-binding antitoxin AbrB/MazE fold protein
MHPTPQVGNIPVSKGWCLVEKTIQAIYANGVLRPLAPVDFLDENHQVTLTVTVPEHRRPLEGWVGGLSDADAGEMRRVIEAEFEQVNPDDWK